MEAEKRNSTDKVRKQQLGELLKKNTVERNRTRKERNKATSGQGKLRRAISRKMNDIQTLQRGLGDLKGDIPPPFAPEVFDTCSAIHKEVVAQAEAEKPQQEAKKLREQLQELGVPSEGPREANSENFSVDLSREGAHTVPTQNSGEKRPRPQSGTSSQPAKRSKQT